MATSRFFINVILVAIVFGTLSQVLLQTSLAPPMEDAQLVGKHLNIYDIQQRRRLADDQLAAKMAGVKAPTLLKKVVEKTDPVTKDDSKTEEFVRSATAPLNFLKTVPQLEESYGSGPNLDDNQARDLYLAVLKDTKAGFNAWLVAHMEDRDQQAAEAKDSLGSSIRRNKHSGSGMINNALATVDDELEHAAVLCSVARSRVRRYVRDRMADRMGAWALFARDAWKYGAKDLGWSIMADAKSKLLSVVGMGGGSSRSGKDASTSMFKRRGNNNKKRSQSIADGMLDTDNEEEENAHADESATMSRSGAAIASMGACLSADDAHPCPSFAYMQLVRKKTPKDILNSCFRSNEYYNEWFSTEGRANKGAESSGIAAEVVEVVKEVAEEVVGEEQP